jgi:CubicO group peptidase (beta-lactamase class C family)
VCFGTARDRLAVLPTTVFQAASLSKPVTAWLALTLADAGILDLDTDVDTLLPTPLPLHPLCADPGEAVTVRRLLAHRGGVAGRDTTPNRAGTAFIKGAGGSYRPAMDGASRLAQPSALELIAEALGVRPPRPPICRTTPTGRQFSYSGAGYLLVQHAIEVATGMTFAAAAATYVFEPLAMGHSTFALVPPAEWDLADGHDERGTPLRGGRELTPWSAAGGLYTTAGDMARFAAAMADSPIGAAMAAGLLGVRVAGPRVTHGGDNGGFRAVLAVFPAQRQGVIVLTNGKASDQLRLRNDLADATIAAFSLGP